MYRNPSPPPKEKQNNLDRIGGTAYSRCWVLNALVSLSSQSVKEDEDLPEELENEFCQLWDMSSDKRVGQYMLDQGVCDLVLAPLVRSTHHRVREVGLGIIGNLMCHAASAKAVTEHSVLCTYIPSLMKDQDDISVLIEVVRLLRAALSHDITLADKWLALLPDNIVERLIHIIQSTLTMTSVRAKVLNEHCGYLLEILFYRDDKLLANSSYTVFPIVDILQDRKSFAIQEPLLRCLQYLSEEQLAIVNMTKCPSLPGILHGVLSQKIEHSLTAVCLSLVCTLLVTSLANDEMCAWLEKDGNITNAAIKTLQRIIEDDGTRDDAENINKDTDRNTDHAASAQNSSIDNTDDLTNKTPASGFIDTPTPKTADRLRVTPSTPIRLVTPTYGTPCGVPTPTSHSNSATPQSTLSTPYSVQRRGIFTPANERIRRQSSEPSRPILEVCMEMCWNFLYTLANHIPTEGSCVLRYLSDGINDLIECLISGGDAHVELAMLYKQHLEKYPHFSAACNKLDKFITTHTVISSCSENRT